jgi:hypothetical protein
MLVSLLPLLLIVTPPVGVIAYVVRQTSRA